MSVWEKALVRRPSAGSAPGPVEEQQQMRGTVGGGEIKEGVSSIT